MESKPVDENVCDIKMNALTEKLGLMLQPITQGIARIEGDISALKQGAAGLVSMDLFREKCREIEELKRFVWRVSGGLSVLTFLLGLAAKLLK